MRISANVCAVTMLEGHFVFLADSPSKAVSTWLGRWFHEVLHVRTGWNQNQDCYRPNWYWCRSFWQHCTKLSVTLVQALFEILSNISAVDWAQLVQQEVTILLLKQCEMSNIKKGIQVFTWHKVVTDSGTQGPLHLWSTAPQPSWIIWHRLAAWPPSGSPWLLCSAASWPGRSPVAQPCPGLHLRSCWLWPQLAEPAHPPSLGSCQQHQC